MVVGAAALLTAATGVRAEAPRNHGAGAQQVSAASDEALIVVDVQNDFIPGGSLPVKDGRAVIPVINQLAPYFENIVLTQDWHPKGHVSFATSHPGHKPFDVLQTAYGSQVLWPEHCVQGSDGAQISADLQLAKAQLIIRKGYRTQMDSYSAFEEADHHTKTGLSGYLRARGIRKVYVVGLATDFCVAWTAMDAKRLGFEAAVVEDATRPIDTDGSLGRAWTAMKTLGVLRIQSREILATHERLV